MSFIDESRQFKSPTKNKQSSENLILKYNSIIQQEEDCTSKFKNNDNNIPSKLLRMDSDMIFEQNINEDNIKNLNTLNEIFQFDEKKNSNELVYQRLLRRPSFRKNLSLIMDKEKKKDKEKVVKRKSIVKENSLMKKTNKDSPNMRRRSIINEVKFMSKVANLSKSGFFGDILKKVKLDEKEIYREDIIGNASDFVSFKKELPANVDNCRSKLANDLNTSKNNLVVITNLSNENLIDEKDIKFNKESM